MTAVGIEDHPAWRAREARRLKEKLEGLTPRQRTDMGQLPRYEGGCLTVSRDPAIVVCQVNEGATE